MRTGAVSTADGCGAWKWTTLLGAAFALGAGETPAQTPNATATAITVFAESPLEVDEGRARTFTVGANGTVPANTTIMVDVLVAVGAGDDHADFRLNALTLPDNPGEFVSGASVELRGPTSGSPAAPAPVMFTLTAGEDGDAEDGRNVLTFSTSDVFDPGDGIGRELDPAMLAIAEDDNDTVGVTVSPASLSVREGDAVGRGYTVVLDSQPAHPVTVTAAVTSPVNARIRVAAAGGAAGDEQALTFTTVNWDRPQTVTVTALTDPNLRGGSAAITHTASSFDADYDGIAVGGVSVREVDSARTLTLSTSAGSVREGGRVTVTATLGNPGGAASPTLPGAVTVALAAKPGSTAEDGDWSAPDITIEKDRADGSVTLTARHDADDADEMLTLVGSVSTTAGIFVDGPPEVGLNIADDDTYTLTAAETEVMEGDDVALTVAVAPPAALDTKVGIDLYWASGATVEPAPDSASEDGYVVIPRGGDAAEFILKTAEDPNDRDDDTVVARAMLHDDHGGAVVGERVRIKVFDAQAPARRYTLALAPASIPEGGGAARVTATVTADRAVSDETALVLRVAGGTAASPDDYTLAPASPTVVIARGGTRGAATLTVTPVADGRDEANETIELGAWDGGTRVGNVATLTLVDGAPADGGITAKPRAEVRKVFDAAVRAAGGLAAGGDPAYVDMSRLFDVADPGAAVSYTASSSDAGVLAADVAATDPALAATVLRLTPMAEGASTVTVAARGADGAVATLTVVACAGPCVWVTLDVGPAGVPVPALPPLVQGLLAALLLAGGAYRRRRPR